MSARLGSDREVNDALIEAVGEGDLKLVNSLLASGAKITWDGWKSVRDAQTLKHNGGDRAEIARVLKEAEDRYWKNVRASVKSGPKLKCGGSLSGGPPN